VDNCQPTWLGTASISPFDEHIPNLSQDLSQKGRRVNTKLRFVARWKAPLSAASGAWSLPGVRDKRQLRYASL